MDGPFPKVSLKHLPAGNLHRVPVVHTVSGKHTLCKWFFIWNGTHTTRDRLLMATVSAKANARRVALPYRLAELDVFPAACTPVCRPTHPYVHGEECKCRQHWKTGNKEKSLRVPVNPQKAVCENALMWLKQGVGTEKAVLLFKFDLHMFYFVINSFSVPADDVTLIDKGTEEIKQI